MLLLISMEIMRVTNSQEQRLMDYLTAVLALEVSALNCPIPSWDYDSLAEGVSVHKIFMENDNVKVERTSLR